jgi:hypothetical protein
MKNSTILFVFGLLGLSGVGAYLYLKNKKAPSSSTPSSSSTPTNDTPSASTSGSTSVADSSLGLNPIIKTTSIVSNGDVIKTIEKDSTTGITKTITTDIKSGEEVTTITKSDPTNVSVRTITEEEKNKLEAIQLASQIRTLNSMPSYVKPYNAGTLTREYTNKINALGYKLLSDFNIEKM